MLHVSRISWRPRVRLSLLATVFAAGVLHAPSADAYDQYSVAKDATNCRGCHGNFRDNNYTSLVDGENWGNIHNLHRSTMVEGDCGVCHTDPGRFPVFIGSSEGGSGFDAISCAGCHGRNEDFEDGVTGRGAGLRQHHTNALVPPDGNGQFCVDCHADADPGFYTPVGEDVAPAYYFLPDASHPNKPTDACNPTLVEEDFAGAVFGLDNDGDLVRDESDTDCGAPIPVPILASVWARWALAALLLFATTIAPGRDS